jgi:hypothetical protein
LTLPFLAVALKGHDFSRAAQLLFIVVILSEASPSEAKGLQVEESLPGQSHSCSVKAFSLYKPLRLNLGKGTSTRAASSHGESGFSR